MKLRGRLMNMRVPILCLVVFALVAAACGSDEPIRDIVVGEPSDTSQPDSTTTSVAPVETGTAAVDAPRSGAQPAAELLEAVRAADNRFGLDILRNLTADAESGGENMLFSPYSLAAALSMLYAGADGDTAAQMAEAMHLSVADADLHAVRNHIDAALAVEPEPQFDGDDRLPFVVRPANSVWGQAGYPFSTDYLGLLAEFYGAGLLTVDYVADPESARLAINSWVEEATENRIEDLVPATAIDDLTRLVLVNAIWFNAAWASQFDAGRTVDGDFTLLDGSTVSVPLMRGSASQFAEGDGFTALRLPYAGDAAMVVVLPDEALTTSELAAKLNGNSFGLEFGHYSVDVALPRFTFDTEIPLKAVLQDLGMIDVFDEQQANLDAITDAPNDLYVTDAFHKAFIAVDEAGTEAAAATAILAGATSAPPPATFVADRPFLFWIEHNTAGLLFMGQVTDPR